jgi:hypothetical protein
MSLWQSIWTPQSGVLPKLNPLSLYFRLLKLRQLPQFITFELSRAPCPSGAPASLSGLVRVVVADLGKRLPKGSDLGRALAEYSIIPIQIGASHVEAFLEKMQVRRVADRHAQKVLEPYARQVRRQAYPAFPSRIGLLYQLCGISDAFQLYWNREPQVGGARLAIAIYVDVSGSMIGKFPIVATFVNSLREFPLHTYLFDTEVRAAQLDDIGAGRIRGGGGTDFNAPVGHLVSQRDVDAGVLFTDGEGTLDMVTARHLRAARKRLYVVYLLRPHERAGTLDRFATATTIFHCQGE